MKSPKHPTGAQLTLLALAASLTLWAIQQSASSSSDLKRNATTVVQISLLNVSAHFLTGVIMRVMGHSAGTTTTTSRSE